ncbi:RHS repeat domain-containing protein [Blastopirellula marina]|uniref:RHS repeat domain-containing protein n=1 Tax=Blastopirellula marina TaxID=124 RepID=UPI001304E847|nr:RHS repeat-associated core domain-containing protein [Blastopirellula marina]
MTDNLGTVRDLAEYDSGTDTTSIGNHLAYNAFGEIASETNSAVDFLFAFTGRERDEESSLQYNRSRFYESEDGRWISQDPIGFDAGDANLYRYVGNSHPNLVDPSGQEVYVIDRLFPTTSPGPKYWLLDHTYILIVWPDGRRETLSWGNRILPPLKNPPSGWCLNEENDLVGAEKSLKTGKAVLVEDVNVALVYFAFRLLRDAGTESPSHHVHGGPILNCKSEKDRLLSLAKELERLFFTQEDKARIYADILDKFGIPYDPEEVFGPVIEFPARPAGPGQLGPLAPIQHIP